MGTRQNEIDALINELPTICKENLGHGAQLDMNSLTLMGHGFGATTAINYASKDERVKKLITLDPWLIPIKDEV